MYMVAAIYRRCRREKSSRVSILLPPILAYFRYCSWKDVSEFFVDFGVAGVGD
jgi:hypothetical protein